MEQTHVLYMFQIHIPILCCRSLEQKSKLSLSKATFKNHPKSPSPPKKQNQVTSYHPKAKPKAKPGASMHLSPDSFPPLSASPAVWTSARSVWLCTGGMSAFPASSSGALWFLFDGRVFSCFQWVFVFFFRYLGGLKGGFYDCFYTFFMVLGWSEGSFSKAPHLNLIALHTFLQADRQRIFQYFS